MARTRSIIKQEINGYVEDIYNDVLDYVEDEKEAMALARRIAEGMKDYTLEVVWEVSENMEMEIIKEVCHGKDIDRETVLTIVKRVFRYWQR